MSPQVLNPLALGWRPLTDAPNFSPIVKGEINILEEMRPMDNFIYKDTKGTLLNVVMYRYPMGAITKFTKHKGKKETNHQTHITTDTRVYKTPYEGTKPNAFISYYIDAGVDYDIDNNPIKKVKHLQCLPSRFAKMVGWKKGDGMLMGEKMPDTTPAPQLAKQEQEVKRVAGLNAVREAASKK